MSMGDHDFLAGDPPRQQLVFLNTYWGGQYAFASSQARGDQWTATAKFGQHDRLEGSSAAELLEKVHGHYRAHGHRKGQR